MAVVVFDCEVYKDYFLIMFRNVETGTTKYYELYEGVVFQSLSVLSILRKHTMVSFNGRRYDMPIIMLACAGESNQTMKDASDAIIVRNLNHWDEKFRQEFPFASYGRDEFDHIDLIEVAPGRASLKIYGGRLHSRRMQDLPIDPADSITPEMRAQLIEYCGNDLQTTIDLYTSLKPQLELREAMGKHYGVDLRSKSDAQIAENVIRGRVQRDTGEWIDRPEIKSGSEFKYQAPDFVSFTTPALNKVLTVIKDSNFYVSATGNVEMPDALAKTKITIGKSVYRMGIGGLHSSETSVAHVAEGCTIVDRDVASYYPAIILKLSLYPEQMGERFLAVYRDLVRRRLDAKASGNKVAADTGKIVVNGTFGKLGSKWSTLYSPPLLIQTTVTGQLCLLMLIEMLEGHGIPVVSANTDGVVIKCPEGREDLMDLVVWVWETATGFETEGTPYTAIYSRDVNNYVALKKDGGVKLKGVFAPPGLQKNPTTEVCTEAVVAFLEHGTPIESTILGCKDVRKFVSIRKVNGGAVKGETFLGKAVRWYYAQNSPGTITYKQSGYTVARTEGAKPLMILPDVVPSDIDYAWYIKEANDILTDVGWKKP